MEPDVTVTHLGEVPGQERYRLSPNAERFLRQHGDKITVLNMGADLEPVEQDVDEGKDGHLWIPAGRRKRSRIIVPIWAGLGKVKGEQGEQV